MAAKLPRAWIDDLLLRVDLVDLIDQHLPLKKAGSNFVARCPFHNENTPSFSVSRAKQLYHCFGCGASGNAINFLMEYSHLGFLEAVEDLAVFAGVQLPQEVLSDQDSPEIPLTPLYNVLKDAADYYAVQLRTSPLAADAVQYLKNRGIALEAIKEFQLGFAPDEWQSLEKLFDAPALLAAGLLIKNDEGRTYNRFRGRLMFPIRDKRERVLGFGARVLDESLPKYLNSPETPVFQKNKEVYGLFELLKKSGKPERILVVEGYLDVIALAQAGIGNAVATLGTATSASHIELLFRYCSELVFCFDGDNAGRQAAWRAMEVAMPCMREGRIIRIMLLPQGEDPDSLVRQEGKQAFLARVDTAKSLSDYFFENLAAKVNLAEVEGRANFLAQAKPFIDKLPDSIFKNMMQERLRVKAGVSERAVRSHISLNAQSVIKSKFPVVNVRPTVARRIIALLLQHPELAWKVDEIVENWRSVEFPGSGLFKEIVELIVKDKPGSSAVLMEKFRLHPDFKIINLLFALELEGVEQDPESEFVNGLQKVIGDAKQAHLDALIQQLSERNYKDLSLEEKEMLKKYRR